MKKLILNILLILIVISLSECTISKRHYRDGYQISWKKNKSDANAKHNQPVEKTVKVLEIIETDQLLKPNDETELYASTKVKTLYKTKKKNIASYSFPKDTCGDVITMLNGDEIKAKVIEIDKSTIKYKSCENLGGPLFVIPLENVFMIKYANGSKELFSKPVAQPVPVASKVEETKPARKNNGFAIASFICSCLFFLYIPVLAAAVFSIIGYFQFKKKPEKYKRKWMIIPGLIFAAVIVTFLILLLAGAIVAV